MYSSRMRTARSFTVSCSTLGGLPNPYGCRTPGCRIPPMQSHPDAEPPDADPPPWRQTLPGCRPPSKSCDAGKPTTLVNRMTDRCKNITLLQTSFADGNNLKERRDIYKDTATIFSFRLLAKTFCSE